MNVLSDNIIFLIAICLLLITCVGLPIYWSFSNKAIIYQDSSEFANAFLIWACPIVVWLVGLGFYVYTNTQVIDRQTLVIVSASLSATFFLVSLYSSIKTNGVISGILICIFKLLHSPLAIFSAIDYLFNSNANSPVYFFRYIFLFGYIANFNRKLIKKRNYRFILNDLHPEESSNNTIP